MKKKFIVPLAVMTTLTFTGCLPEQQTVTVSDNTVTVSDGTGTDTGTGTGTGTGTSTGSSCTGTSSDGQGDGYSLHYFNLMLAGHQNWVPGTYSNNLATQTMPTIAEAGILFRSDSKLKVRLKVHSQPNPTAGEEYCYGRAVGQGSDTYTYTKLRFQVHLRDIICDNDTEPSNPNTCQSGFRLGNPYRTQYVDPVSVDSCSPIMDFGAYRSGSSYGTVVEVNNVQADSDCQLNGDHCPADLIVRAASCWRMTLQLSTDYTQDFK